MRLQSLEVTSLALGFLVLSLFALSVQVLTVALQSGIASPDGESIEPFVGASPVWSLGEIPLVSMRYEDSVRYGIHGNQADEDWSKLIPHNGGIVHIGPEREPFMLAMFHQLRCLDIMRKSLAEREHALPEGPSDRVVSCLNYIRQTMLCRRDLRLEPVVDVDGPHSVQRWGTMTCKDWRKVYEAHERNMRTDSVLA